MRKLRFRKARGLTVDQDQTQDISPQPLAPASHLFPGPSPGGLEQRNLPFPTPGAMEGEGDLETHPHRCPDGYPSIGSSVMLEQG